MLQGGDLIAEPPVCQSTEIVPAGIVLRDAAQDIQGFLIATVANVLPGGLLITLRIRLLGTLMLTPEGIITAVSGIGFFRIGDLLIGSVDPLHLTGRFFITGV